MNTVEKASLLRNRDEIVKNVDFMYIKDKLLAYGVVSSQDLEDIDCEKTKSAKVRKLLDLLPMTGEKDTFTTFVKILEFDYDWLAERLSQTNNRDSPDAVSHLNSDPFAMIDNSTLKLEHSLMQAGIPFPPSHLIPRHVKVSKIRECIRDMAHGQFVVIHGMAGAGKSVLAAEALRDVDLMNSFKNNVFWLTIGQTGADALLTKMQALCERLDHTIPPPLSVDQATQRLRRLMTDPSRKNSLLVLDDVWRGAVVRAFDFGCKILMTTRDASVTDVLNGRAILVKVQDGFTQEESLSYLADCLNISEQDLPAQANQIYSECKGSPMVLSLLAPLLAERGERPRINVHRWDHYLGRLRDRKYTDLKCHTSYSYGTIDEAIAISFEHLDQETKHSFKDFVIFLDDVYIPATVLQVLWQCTPYEMEERISLLVANSLVAQYVQEQWSTCILLYGIHDLLLDYLKSHMSAEEQRNAHRKLIDAYLNECKSNFNDLPDDNYIFWFLGYHLYKAEYTELFPKIYLNLSFISAKLRATGPSDLLNDFRKYKNYITKSDGQNSQRVEDYMHFVRTCGHTVVQCRQLDIIQLALQQPKNSSVYSDALVVAKSSLNSFYLECRAIGSQTKESMDDVLQSTILSYDQVTAACFTHNGQRLLSAADDGQIRLWDVDSGKELHRFLGHSASIHHLSLSRDSKQFVSSSADGSVKVWDLSTVTCKLDGTSIDHPSSTHLNLPCTISMGSHALVSGEVEQRPNKTPSPPVRPDSLYNIFEVDRLPVDNSSKTYTGHTNEVLNAKFSENGAQIVSCGRDHTARIWLSIACMELGVLDHPETVTTCCFSQCGFYVATGCTDSSIRIWSGNVSLYTCVALFERPGSNPSVRFVSFLSDTSILSVSDTEILKFDWSLPVSNAQEQVGHLYSYSTTEIACANSSCCYQSAALTDNRELLAVATSKDNILLYNVEQSEQIFEYVGHAGAVTSLHFSSDIVSGEPSKWLLSGSLDKTLKVWNVSDVERVDQCSLSCTAFHAVSPPDHPNNFVIATVDSDNRIQVVNALNCETFETIEQEDSALDPVELCVVSHKASMLAWATLSGSVKLMSLNRKKVKTLGHHSDKVSFIKFSPTDVLLLSVSSDGGIKIWKPGKEPNDNHLTITGPRKGVIDCFFVDSEEVMLMVCGVDGSVKLWSTVTGLPTGLILPDSGIDLTCVDRSLNGQWLAQGSINQALQLISIPSESGPNGSIKQKPARKPIRLGHQDGPIRVCRFATHTQLIAVGYDCGVIEVFDYTRYTLRAVMELHQSWVRDLQWCRTSSFFQLVSIGDRIAWWNLDSPSVGSSTPNLHIPLHSNKNNLWAHGAGSLFLPTTSSSTCTSLTSTLSSYPTAERLMQSALSWKLVQTVEFQTRGRYASRLFVSDDGRTLVTVSDSGILYVLHQVSQK